MGIYTWKITVDYYIDTSEQTWDAHKVLRARMLCISMRQDDNRTHEKKVLVWMEY